MRTLHLALIGKPTVTWEDGTRVPVAGKTLGLLAYLAVNAERHSRGALAGLLWGELPEERARGNLRLALTMLRRAIGDHLGASRTHVTMNGPVWLDTAALEGGTEASLALYRGDFLDDLVLQGAPLFEHWVGVERERLRQTALSLLARLSAEAEARGDLDRGVRLARRALSLDGLSEDVHRRLMRLLALGGNRAAALAHYESCRRYLVEHLGVDPSPPTVVLRDQLLRWESHAPARSA